MSAPLAVLGRVLRKDIIINHGAVVVENGIITYAGEREKATLPEDCLDCKEKIIAPGFVDIHCHAGGAVWAYEDPEQMAEHHLKHGTTSLLCTLYRTLSHEQTLEAIEKITAAKKRCKNILGVHMEGPYLNPKYGSKSGTGEPVDSKKYKQIIDTGAVVQWTFSPEQPETDAFLTDIVKAGITPAIGHSAASPEQVFAACDGGARIITHLTNATGAAISPTRYAGTLEVSFDAAALLREDVYYELICDKNGIHVRYDLMRLILKIAGIDRVCAITDCCTDSEDDTDVNFLDGELMGSKLTMDRAAKNFLNLGLSLCDVFKVCAYNPACAIGMQDKIGSIEKGKRADLLACDEQLNQVEVLSIGG